MSKGKRIFLTVVGVAAVVAAFVLVSKLTGGTKNFSEKYEGVNLETEDGQFEREGTYAVYLNDHKDSSKPQGEEIVVDDPNKVLCPNCKKLVPKGKFCFECGYKFIKTCQKCGKEVENGNFCLNCGEKL